MDGHFVLCDDDHCPFRMYITHNQFSVPEGSDVREIPDSVQTWQTGEKKTGDKRFALLHIHLYNNKWTLKGSWIPKVLASDVFWISRKKAFLSNWNWVILACFLNSKKSVTIEKLSEEFHLEVHQFPKEVVLWLKFSALTSVPLWQFPRLAALYGLSHHRQAGCLSSLPSSGVLLSLAMLHFRLWQQITEVQGWL